MENAISKYVIPPYPKNSNCPPYTTDPEGTLDIAEFFYDTIQGEGVGMGFPAAFLRLQGCTLNCQWCDTDWRRGWRYTYEELFQQMDKCNLIDRFEKGHRLVLTGGSPLKQQDRLNWFLHKFQKRYMFIPIIEVENECTIIPDDDFAYYVTIWNNSPKLSSSGMKRQARYKPKVLRTFKYLGNATTVTYKFVVTCEEDWQEIQMDFIDPGYADPSHIILMPLGDTVEELEKHRLITLKLAIKHSVRYSTREQIILNEL